MGWNFLTGIYYRNQGFLAANKHFAFLEERNRPDPDYSNSSITYLEGAARAQPGNPSIHRMLGFIYSSTDREEEAINNWRKSGIVVDELLNRGLEAEKVGDLELALSWYRGVIAVAPHEVEGWLRMGSVNDRREAWSAARETYLAGLSTNPNNSDLQYRLAWTHYQETQDRDWKWIMTNVNNALNQDHFEHEWSKIQSHYLRGEALRGLGHTSEALTEYQWVLSRDPGNYWSILRMAEMIWVLERDAENAKQWLKEAIAIDPESKWAYRYLAELYAETGKIHEATTLYEKVIQLDPNDPLATKWLFER
jgi:tetratricopeptide (TPR) repeat protein